MSFACSRFHRFLLCFLNIDDMAHDSSALVEEYREIINVTSLVSADRRKINTTRFTSSLFEKKNVCHQEELLCMKYVFAELQKPKADDLIFRIYDSNLLYKTASVV